MFDESPSIFTREEPEQVLPRKFPEGFVNVVTVKKLLEVKYGEDQIALEHVEPDSARRTPHENRAQLRANELVVIVHQASDDESDLRAREQDALGPETRPRPSLDLVAGSEVAPRAEPESRPPESRLQNSTLLDSHRESQLVNGLLSSKSDALLLSASKQADAGGARPRRFFQSTKLQAKGGAHGVLSNSLESSQEFSRDVPEIKDIRMQARDQSVSSSTDSSNQHNHQRMLDFLESRQKHQILEKIRILLVASLLVLLGTMTFGIVYQQNSNTTLQRLYNIQER